MREIKFRAWDTKKERFDYYPLISNGSVYNVDAFDDLVEYSEGRMILQQYTGLKDKNGKEIYEGDFLQDDDGIGEVEWVNEHCGFRVFTRNPSLYHNLESDGSLRNSLVIGNIYEHSYLIGR